MSSQGAQGARMVKIGRSFRNGRFGATIVVPFIRLSGLWLEKAGFRAGDHFLVDVRPDGIRLIRQEQKPSTHL